MSDLLGNVEMNDSSRGKEPERGIKAYFTAVDARESDPKVVAAYVRSMETALPRIIDKVRESERLAATIPLTRSTSQGAKDQS